MQLTINQMYQTYLALHSLLNSKQALPSKFLYRVSRNYTLLKPFAEAFERAKNIDNNAYLQKFAHAKQAIIEQICLRDEQGQPQIDANGKYQFSPPKAGDLAIAELINQFPGIEEEFTKFNNDLLELGQTLETVPLLQIAEADLPETMPANLMQHLFFMIES